MSQGLLREIRRCDIADRLDRVFLSTDQTIDSQDRLLTEARWDSVLQLAETYTTALDIPLPQGVFGDFFLLVQTDATDLVPESTDEGNNVLEPELHELHARVADTQNLVDTWSRPAARGYEGR